MVRGGEGDFVVLIDFDLLAVPSSHGPSMRKNGIAPS